ncbi:Glutathione-binding protein GsiB precursor [Aliarcobacter thereius]|uniref:Glutathione-binding protein GsiB n=1 Tax=Aliarcobacter thereius TaxID=544718 RepID=A0A1C0B7B0_9BACT|nr:ABC transporter substrate-binding protein [Aliarcobacter thereius]OCL99422.1 Glutathione-binding protein GsiB precursor [Aliarcobacter thereius]
MFRTFFLIYIISISLFSYESFEDKLDFREDTSNQNKASKLHPKSHIKIFLPSLPYSYVAKATNSGLLRTYDNKDGWIYDLAESHERLDDFTYIFTLRDNLKFQDGTDFSVDDVIYNLKFFRNNPYLYTNIDKVDFDIFKLDSKRVKIVLKSKYELFLNDLAAIYFYKKEYINKYNPVGKYTGTANKIAGAFSMGPYILKDGFAIGDKHTEKLELIANPYYWDKRYPKIKRITVYTQLDVNKAIEDITKNEGKLDFMPIPFNKKFEVILSKYSKLTISKSTDNFIVFFNLINGNKKLKEDRVRVALNQALNQENLLNFVYKNEGRISPFTASINYDIVEQVAKDFKIEEEKIPQEDLKTLLNGLKLNIFTQDRFLFLLKGIEFQLSKYGVEFNYTITRSEKDIYQELLTTSKNENKKDWDLLVWGDDDWYGQNPWSVFFIYKYGSAWSTIPKDEFMQNNINNFFITKTHTKEYKNIVKNILHREREKAYTLRVPSLNNVFALNKELIFKPYRGGVIPLWEMGISINHWSIRDDEKYDKELEKPIKPKRIK